MRVYEVALFIIKSAINILTNSLLTLSPLFLLYLI